MNVNSTDLRNEVYVPKLTGQILSACSLACFAALAFAVAKGRPRGNGGAVTMCVVTTPGFVACTGSNEHGLRGAGTNTTQGSFNLVRTATSVLDSTAPSVLATTG